MCVGKSMGEGNPSKAKVTIVLTTVLILAIDVAMAGGLMGGRD